MEYSKEFIYFDVPKEKYDLVYSHYLKEIIPNLETAFVSNFLLAINAAQRGITFPEEILENNKKIGHRLGELYLVFAFKLHDPKLFDMAQEMIHPERGKFDTIYLPSNSQRVISFKDKHKITDDHHFGVAYMIEEIDYQNIESARPMSKQNENKGEK